MRHRQWGHEREMYWQRVALPSMPRSELTVGGPRGSRLLLPVEDPAPRPADRILPDAFAGQDPGFAFARD